MGTDLPSKWLGTPRSPPLPKLYFRETVGAIRFGDKFRSDPQPDDDHDEELLALQVC